MYQPAHNKFIVDDPLALLTELAQHRAATLVSLGEDDFWTTMLPLIVDGTKGDHGELRGHVARANKHWRHLEGDGRAVAIFYGPDTYISPAWYEEKRLTGKVVPTWNYTMAVVHGNVSVTHDHEWLLENVRALTLRHETPRPDPWHIDDAPADYIDVQAKAIVGLQFTIERIDAKQKLSQNRSAADFEGVLAAMSEGLPRERAVARDMSMLTKRPRDATRS
ncbi:MAG: transcriptional regulator [Chloroflexota bacterium]|jgi:transcriptional regulator|nr:transcriptional regulator [Chloroflexota bacterium]